MDECEESAIKACLAWVPFSNVNRNPTPYNHLDEAGIDTPVDTEVEHALNMTEKIKFTQSDLDKELNMDDYDNEDLDNMMGAGNFTTTKADIALIEQGDPLLKLGDESADEDEIDLEIAPNEFCLVVGNVENGDECEFETYLYDHKAGTSSIHHATMLNAFPLSIDALPTFKNMPGKNWIAVSSFLPFIEIYDNDIIGVLEPQAILDSEDCHHSDAITCIRSHHNRLLSVSHDGSAIIWNLDDSAPVKHYNQLNAGKLTCCRWAPTGDMFVATSENGNAYVVDCKSDAVRVISINEPIDSVCWDSSIQNRIFFGTNSGTLVVYDMSVNSVTCEITATDGPVLCMTDTDISNVLVLGTEAGECIAYRTDGPTPCELLRKEFKQGALYDVARNREIPHVVAFGAEEVVIFDLSSNDAYSKLLPC